MAQNKLKSEKKAYNQTLQNLSFEQIVENPEEEQYNKLTIIEI